MTVNLRKCICCKKIADKKNMFRIMKTYNNGEILLSPTNKDFGRSIYICKSKDCVEKAIKKRQIEHFTKSQDIEKLKKRLIESL